MVWPGHPRFAIPLFSDCTPRVGIDLAQEHLVPGTCLILAIFLILDYFARRDIRRTAASGLATFLVMVVMLALAGLVLIGTRELRCIPCSEKVTGPMRLGNMPSLAPHRDFRAEVGQLVSVLKDPHPSSRPAGWAGAGLCDPASPSPWPGHRLSGGDVRRDTGGGALCSCLRFGLDALQLQLHRCCDPGLVCRPARFPGGKVLA